MNNIQRNFLIVIILTLCGLYGKAQILDSAVLNHQPVFAWEQLDTLANKDAVYRIKIKRKMPANFDSLISTFPNLQELTLQGLRLKNIPQQVFHLSNLTVLNVENNKIEEIPSEISHLVHLERLILNRNYISFLPKEIALLKNLTYLDMWSNNIIELPDEISALKETLKTIDMRVILMSDERKIMMQALLPKTEFLFSKSCNCKM
ncbi:MAG: leucine-rich repeat domain-containing protein [Bacteroidales bacterium]|nr:leucine-rich repeat domain-containing protein [Bacteroidales bacterium]